MKSTEGWGWGEGQIERVREGQTERKKTGRQIYLSSPQDAGRVKGVKENL